MLLEQRCMMANDFMNSLDSLDVDEDGTHSPLDILVIVNDLNRNGARALPSVRPVGTALIDVDGDHSISPLDALVLINHINKKNGLTNGLARNLSENGGLATEELIHIGTSQPAGSRLYKMKIEAVLAEPTDVAVGDLFAVYVTKNSDGSQNLQDRGIESSPIFTMTAHGNEITPGVSMYDGQFLTVDLTAIAVDSAYLRFQLLNHDPINVSHVIVTPISNLVDPEGVGATQEYLPRILADAGPSLDTSKLVPAANVSLKISEVQSDTAGLYQADVAISNQGSAIGRETVIVLKGLPSGVTVDNPSGLTAQGEPYLNLKNAIPSGGLGKNQQSVAVRASIKNPNNLQFPIRTEILSGQVNRAPSLAPIANISIMPGAVFSLKLLGVDLDGDELRYSIRSSTPLPTTTINGELVKFSPDPTQIGEYQFDVVVTDGRLSATQNVHLSVIADPNTTTRLSGKILNVQGAPIVGLRIEVGSQQSLTQTDGSFALNFGSSPPVSDTIRVRADLHTSGSYPFIAEKLALLLEHEVYTGFNNQIERPIFLPTLNIGSTVNPATSQTIAQQLAPNEALASVQIAAGTLFNQQGSLYTGKLSITEVPVDRTPAVLPSNISANLIVTIQPGEMTFATPTPITLPNRSKLVPGSDLDLWSINPTTGTFEVVGKGRVSPDGSKIDTIEGGVRFSSWHGFVPPSINPLDETASPQCETPKATCHTSSNVVIYSGEYIEHHEMPSYSSNGVDRSVTLVYSSMRSAPEQIVRFNTDLPGWFNPTGNTKDYLGAKVNITRAGLSYGVSGQQLDNAGNAIVETGDIQGIGRVSAGFQFDMRELPDGVYDYSAAIGAYRPDGSLTMGSRTPLSGQFVKVSSQGSAFGEGWGIAGLQRIIPENGGESLILVDGNGSEFLFNRTGADAYKGPLGDFSVLSQRFDGTFERRMTNGTTYRFDTSQRLATVADSNGNLTKYEYSSQGQLARIIDPVGMITTFSYLGGRLSEIALPDGRKTALTINANGDLIQITDPDGSTRRFDYDASHRLVKESTPLGYEEHTEYDVFGRVRKVVRADGSVMLFSPAELKGVQLNSLAKTFTASLPSVSNGGTQIVMPTGNVISNKLNRNGLVTETRDSFGLRATYTYDENLRLASSVDSKGSSVGYSYDSNGNVKSTEQLVTVANGELGSGSQISADGISFPGREVFFPFYVNIILDVTTADINGDSFKDIVAVGYTNENSLHRVTLATSFGDGHGAFGQPIVSYGPSMTQVSSLIVAGDIDNDGTPDIVTVDEQSIGTLRVFKGSRDGTFTLMRSLVLADGLPSQLLLNDINNDNRPDLVMVQGQTGKASYLLNQGSFDYATPVAVVSDVSIQKVAFAEMTGDSFPELVAVNYGQGAVRIFQGGSQLAFPEIERKTGPSISDFIVADFDGDQKTDIAVSTSASSSLMFFKGTGLGKVSLVQTVTLVSSATTLTRIDLNGDGTPDIVAKFGDGKMAALKISVGVFSIVNTASLLGASTKEIGFAVVEGGEEYLLRKLVGIQVVAASSLLGPVTSRFLQTPFTPTLAVLGDYDGDGNLDIAASDGQSRQFMSMLGDGNGRFSTPTTRTDLPAQVMVAADFNKDGRDDLLTYSTKNLSIVSSGSDGQFGSPRQIDNELNPNRRLDVSVADFNGDSVPDIAVGGRLTNASGGVLGDRLYIYLSNGQGGYTKSNVDYGGGAWPYPISDDFDGDGKKDLVVTSIQSLGDFLRSSVYYLKNDGNGQFAAPTVVTSSLIALDIAKVATGDLNGDGKADIVASIGNVLKIFINDGSGNFGQSPTREIELSSGICTAIRIVDINGDGKADIVSSENNNGSVIGTSIFLGQGNGLFNDRTRFRPSVTPDSDTNTSVGDLNSDGSLDLVLATSNGFVLLGVNDAITNATLRQRYSYDSSFSRITTATDELGRVTRYVIAPSNGNVLEVQRPLGSTDVLTYTQQGLVQSYTDPLGHITQYEYGPQGRVTGITSGKGTVDESTVHFAYDAVGNITTLTDPRGNVTRFEYDAMRRVSKETDALGGVTRYTRDAKGNILTSTDVLGRVSKYTYDALSRILTSTDPLGNVSRFAYDASGNLTSVIDANGNVSRNEYDVANRRVRSIDALGGITRFSYDRNNNLLSVTDPNGNITRYFYDERNRVVRELDPLGKSSFYLYDGVDNLIAKKDRDDRQTQFTFDSLDRLITERWKGTKAGQYVNTISSVYDVSGNLKSIEDSFSKLTFTYDSLDRMKSVSNAGTPNTASVLLSYAYDTNGNRTSVNDVIIGVNGATVVSQFDALDRLKQVTQTGASTSTKRVDFGFNAIGQYMSIARSNNADGTVPVVTTTFGYDGSNRLSLIDHKGAAGSSHASFGYEYDSASRITRITEKNQTIDYAYDKRDQLVSANYSDAARTDESFKFDANGNRVQSNAHGNAYQTEPGNRLKTDGVYNYAYDAEGNLTKRTEIATGNTREFQWDHRNRLTMLSDKNASGVLQQVVRYTYDSFGRRISKQVDTTPLDTVDAAIEQFVYDGDDVILDFVDADGSGPAASQQTTRYLRGPGIDNLLAIESASGTNWVLQDHLGSTRALVSSAGVLVQSIDYDSFGKAIVAGSLWARYLYTGRELDVESGLFYYRARYYDSSIGRFTNEDPIGFAGGSWNTQIYVDNSPISWIDPMGLFNATIVDSGGRNGPTYGGTMTITGRNGQTVTVPVSTWPNPKNGNPGITPETYPGTYGPKKHKERQPDKATNGITINDRKPVPTLGPNPAKDGGYFATGINLHCGYSDTSRGSAGCVTISPKHCEEVWGVLEPDETGFITVSRPKKKK